MVYAIAPRSLHITRTSLNHGGHNKQTKAKQHHKKKKKVAKHFICLSSALHNHVSSNTVNMVFSPEQWAGK